MFIFICCISYHIGQTSSFQSIKKVLNLKISHFCFLVGILWERVNETGAFWGLMSALVIGFIRMVLDFVYPAPGCGEPDERPEAAAAILFHYMYFALFLFWWTVIIIIIISLLTQPIPEDYVSSIFMLLYYSFISLDKK